MLIQAGVLSNFKEGAYSQIYETISLSTNLFCKVFLISLFL